MEEDEGRRVNRQLDLNDVDNDMGLDLIMSNGTHNNNDMGGSDDSRSCSDDVGVDGNDLFSDEEDEFAIGQVEEDECFITGYKEGGNVQGEEEVGDKDDSGAEDVGTPRDIGEKVVEEPTFGMVFSSWDEINDYYKRYGKQEGFGVARIGGRKGLRNDGSKIGSNYVWKCECYGSTKYRSNVNGKRVVVVQDPLVKRKSKKCNCTAMMYASANEAREWVIKKVNNSHNHDLAPQNSKHIPMYKKEKISKMVEFRIDNDHAAGSSLCQIYNNVAQQRNGYENMWFSKKDMYNMVDRKTRLKLRDGDAMAMLDYFQKMTEDNQIFFHMHRVDKFGRLKDILWVDARSRVAYQHFGDVVCFDSTYLTNKYRMPFSNFVGVNHHGQSVLLGCALLSQEDAETFVWLFKTWLSCMGGKPPAAIMTDQDQAMRKAIAEVFPMPQTYHRWCMWHIMQKFSRVLGSLSKYEEIKESLKRVIYNSLSAEEFVDSWKGVMEKYKLKGKKCNTWLESLFSEREMWIPTYVRHVFWAGMQTTQRVESINSFFDGYVKKSTRLFEFAPRYCKAMESRVKDEQEADANSSRFVRPLVSEFPLERTFQKLYTDAKFLEVQIQCTRVMYLTPLSKRNISDTVSQHVVEDRVWVWSKSHKREVPIGKKKRNVSITFDMETSFAECDCKHFESHGIVCSHIIKVLDMHSIYHVPEKYVLNRWRKDIRRKHTRVKVAYHDPSKTEDVQRYDKVMVAFEPVVLRACVSDEAVAMLLEQIRVMVLQLDEKDGKIGGGASGVGNNNNNTNDRAQNCGSPCTPCSVNKVNGNGGSTPQTPHCSPLCTPTESLSPMTQNAATPINNGSSREIVKDPVRRARKKKAPAPKKKKPATKRKKRSKGKSKRKKRRDSSTEKSSSDSGSESGTESEEDRATNRPDPNMDTQCTPTGGGIASQVGTYPSYFFSQPNQFWVAPNGQPIMYSNGQSMNRGNGMENFQYQGHGMLQRMGQRTQPGAGASNVMQEPVINYSSVGGIQLSNMETLQYFTNNFQR